MKIRAFALHIETRRGRFGFIEKFGPNLTIIRGNNSSGKSTFFNTLLFALGMEELIGGKGEGVLQYAVREHFDYAEERIEVASSRFFVELENAKGDVITMQRSIKDSARHSKLMEIYSAAHLTESEPLCEPTPTYLHDRGGAQNPRGFHNFLEQFIGLQLPRVPTASGGEAKLYLQAVFAALAVEQKRGWTDYIANIPFYGIRDARTRVAEFMLGLSVFESSAARNRLNDEARKIEDVWCSLSDELRRAALDSGVVIQGLPKMPSESFAASQVQFIGNGGDADISLDEYIRQLRAEHEALEERLQSDTMLGGVEVTRRIDATLAELQQLSEIRDQAAAALTLQRASLREYEELLQEAREDLERNKTAAKLRGLGAEHGLDLAHDRCPTCHQMVADTLLPQTDVGPQMDLQTNIAYLESQCRTLGQQIAALRAANAVGEAKLKTLAERVAAKHDELNGLRGDAGSGSQLSKAIFRRQVQIEALIARIESFVELATRTLQRLELYAEQFAANQRARKKLPKNYYSERDDSSIRYFEKLFRANAQSFGYESAPINDIEISRDTLMPFLAHLELREILSKRVSRTDIRSDSSASDFVRLIWSFLLGLYQASVHKTVGGNHPGVLLFDEPGQHSMAESSQHALLKSLAGESKLQSIVAASFDESESVFLSATSGIKFKLVQWDGQVIRPL